MSLETYSMNKSLYVSRDIWAAPLRRNTRPPCSQALSHQAIANLLQMLVKAFQVSDARHLGGHLPEQRGDSRIRRVVRRGPLLFQFRAARPPKPKGKSKLGIVKGCWGKTTNERTSERTNGRTNERTNDRTNKQTNKKQTFGYSRLAMTRHQQPSS